MQSLLHIAISLNRQGAVIDFDILSHRKIHLDEAGTCKVVMTFTDTACSCAESLPIEIVARLKEIEGIEDVKVEVTWSPAWKITRISRYGRIALGLPPR